MRLQTGFTALSLPDCRAVTLAANSAGVRARHIADRAKENNTFHNRPNAYSVRLIVH